MIQFAIYAAPGGVLIADFSAKIENALFASNDRGFAEASGFIPLSLVDTFRIFDRAGMPHVLFNDGGDAIYEGRLEDVAIVPGGIQVRAFGYARSATDIRYTCFWSTVDYSKWIPVTTVQLSGRAPQKYNFDTNGQIYIGSKKNQVYTTGVDLGAVILKVPYGSRNKIRGIQFDLEQNWPSPGGPSWQLYYATYLEGFASGVIYNYSNTAGVVVNRSYLFTIAAASCDYLEFGVYNSTGAPSTPAGEDGASYLKMTNLRVVGSTANMVSCQMATATPSAGTFTITVSGGNGTTNMYVGQRLFIDPGNFLSESVIVTAVTSTTFTATFLQAAGHAIGTQVSAFGIQADEIVIDIATAIDTLNPSQINPAAQFIQSPRVDQIESVYEDAIGADVLDQLAAAGDTSNNSWEWGIYNSQFMFFRPQITSQNRTWYVDASDVHIDRSVDNMYNSVYAKYKDAFNRSLRTAAQTDPFSTGRFSLIRQQEVDVDTIASSIATAQANVTLDQISVPVPKSGIKVEMVFDSAGQRWPLWYVRGGDLMILRNIPPTLSTSIDNVRVFRIARAEYHFSDNTLSIEPSTPLPTLDRLLATLSLKGKI